MSVIQISIRQDLFERLKGLAEPLVDDVNSVIERVLDHYEKQKIVETKNQVFFQSTKAENWVSARGEHIPVGSKLRASYLNRKFEAVITKRGINFNNEVFDSPSSAAEAVKRLSGKKGTSACTNGWSFWEICLPDTDKWLVLSKIKQK